MRASVQPRIGFPCLRMECSACLCREWVVEKRRGGGHCFFFCCATLWNPKAAVALEHPTAQFFEIANILTERWGHLGTAGPPSPSGAFGGHPVGLPWRPQPAPFSSRLAGSPRVGRGSQSAVLKRVCVSVCHDLSPSFPEGNLAGTLAPRAAEKAKYHELAKQDRIHEGVGGRCWAFLASPCPRCADCCLNQPGPCRLTCGVALSIGGLSVAHSTEVLQPITTLKGKTNHKPA